MVGFLDLDQMESLHTNVYISVFSGCGFSFTACISLDNLSTTATTRFLSFLRSTMTVIARHADFLEVFSRRSELQLRCVDINHVGRQIDITFYFRVRK